MVQLALEVDLHLMEAISCYCYDLPIACLLGNSMRGLMRLISFGLYSIGIDQASVLVFVFVWKESYHTNEAIIKSNEAIIKSFLKC